MTTDHFISLVKKRITRAMFVKNIGPAVCVIAIILVVQSLSYVLDGYKVNTDAFSYTLAAGLLAYVIYTLTKLPTHLEAARYADKFFEMKDSLISQIDLNKREKLSTKEEQIIKLQNSQTQELCNKQNVNSIPIIMPIKSLGMGAALLVLTAFLCSFDDSPQVKQKVAEEKEILEATENNIKQMEQTVKDLEEKMSEKEKDMMKSSRLKELLKGLTATKSKLDALRQYAKLEKEIGKIKEKMKLRDDEKLLAEIGRELEKNRSTSKMGKMLSNKDYKEAADELEEQRKELKKAFEKFKKNDERALQRLQKLMDDMKKMANKMKNASDNLQSNYSNMRSDISNMSDAADELSEKLKEVNVAGIIHEKDLQEGMKEAGEAAEDLDNVLLVISDKLKDTDTKKKFRARLNAMQQALANCQSCVNGGNGQGQGQGKGIGSGSVDSLNDETSDLEPGFDTKITGTKGKGPSVKQVEQAQTGSGVASTRKTSSKSIEYKRQMEAFILQENVPEVMKNGVKEYFKKIHEEQE